MPQLNFAWWFFNFLISWATLAILITIISNKSLTPNNIVTPYPSTSQTQTNNWHWN